MGVSATVLLVTVWSYLIEFEPKKAMVTSLYWSIMLQRTVQKKQRFKKKSSQWMFLALSCIKIICLLGSTGQNGL